MTYEEIDYMIGSIAEELGCDYAYYQFPEGSARAKNPPYLIFYIGSSDDLFADNINYAKIRTLVIEFYSEFKDFEMEDTIEGMLKEFGLGFERNESWIDSERMNQITYTMEVMING